MDSNFVLVADDDPGCREALVIALRMLGVLVISAADGVQALDLAISHRPRLIFMDLNMPRMDGLEAARAIRHQVDASEIPIVAMSAHCDGQRWQAFQSSCAQSLKKPWVPDDLRQILDQFWLRITHRAVQARKNAS